MGERGSRHADISRVPSLIIHEVVRERRRGPVVVPLPDDNPGGPVLGRVVTMWKGGGGGGGGGDGEGTCSGGCKRVGNE